MSSRLLTRQSLPRYVERLRAIRPDTRPLWGRMTPSQFMPHLRSSVEMALEEREAPDESTWFKSTVVRVIAFHVIPWPKGIQAPAYFFPEPDQNLDEERERLVDTLQRFVEAAEREPRRVTRHPVFGRMTLRYWGRVIGMHADHHLRQFGV